MIASLVAAALLSAFASCEEPWRTAGFLPGVERPRGAASAAKWLWDGETPSNGSVCYFRKSFLLNGSVASARARLAFDDRAEVYLNGRRQADMSAFGCSLLPGTNVIAVCVSNVTGAAGLLFFGEVALADGRTMDLRSDRSFRCADRVLPGWNLIGYDDGAWRPAREQGDVLMAPFANYCDYRAGFMSERERAALKERETEFDDLLPPGLSSDPPISAKVVYDGILPWVEVNGVRVRPWFNLNAPESDYDWNQAVKFASLGVRFHRIALPMKDIEIAPGKYDFSGLDRMARRILAFVPDAYLTIPIPLTLPKWCECHPEGLVGYGDGAIGTCVGDELTGRPKRPSAASSEYRSETTRLIDALGDYVRRQPWGNRVAALRPNWGVYTEWHTYGFYHSPDTGPAMTKAFRHWKGGLYAGMDPPGPDERTHGGIVLDPIADRRTLDYFECLQSETADFMLHLAKDVKRNFPGRLVGFYYGYVLTANPPEGANVLLDRVLSAPEVDFLSDPASYTPGSRRAGGAYCHRTIPSAYRRFGKLCLIEDDMRHHHVLPSIRKDWSAAYCARTPQESRMTMRRNLINCLFDGCGIQFVDAVADRGIRFSAHDDPAVLLGFHEARKVFDAAGRIAGGSGNRTALVVDWRECLRLDNKAYRNPVFKLLMERGPELAYRSGVAFDLLSLDDYLSCACDYTGVVFLNSLLPTSDCRVAVRRKLEQSGTRAVRFALSGSSHGDLGPSVQELEEAPKDSREWRDVFVSVGAEPIAAPGNYVRQHAGLICFHTADKGRHLVKKPVGMRNRGCIELFSERRYEDETIEIVTDGPDTLLLKAE